MKAPWLLLIVIAACPAFCQTNTGGGASTGSVNVSCTQATPCAASPANLVASATNAMYRVDVSVVCTASTSTATATITIAYTDPSSTAQSIAPASAAACTTLGTASVASVSQTFTAKAGTAITYVAATASGPSYQARISLLQETSN
jgi:hypothetical protein